MPLPQNNTYQNHHYFSRTILYLIVVVWLLILGWAVMHRNQIWDWWLLRNYQAPADISAIASQDTMTAYGEHMFYINHPDLQDKGPFSSSCPNNGGEQTIVLGCYHSLQSGIDVLKVSDVRLDGVEQVTAAHEMLHAAYDRLSSADRNSVDAMLEDYYNHDLHDQRIKTVIAAYKKSEPNDVVNEMHSVFGTEVSNLPAPLETYYKRYFTNRQQVAAFAAQYQAEFTSRQTTIAEDDARLSSLKSQIQADEADLKTKQATINAQQATLLSERSSNPSAYNAGVPAYNQLIVAYNSEVQTVQSLVNQYNQLVASRNAVALEEDELVNDLSSTPQPITSN